MAKPRPKLQVKRADQAPGRVTKRLPEIRPCASRHAPECKNPLIVDAHEHNPENPGTNPHPASRRLLSRFLVRRGFRLDLWHLRLRGWLRRLQRRARYIINIVVHAECLPGSVEPSFSVTMLTVVGAR